MKWDTLSTKNIEKKVISFQPSGTSTDGNIALVFDLDDENIPGEVVLEVTPIGGLCTGDPVVTTITINRDDGGPTPPVPCLVTASEILSPNGGNNNDWKVIFPANDPENYAVKIFSRGGQMVYEANSMQTAWTGEGCPDGPYYYIIMNKKNGGECRGAVSILR